MNTKKPLKNVNVNNNLIKRMTKTCDKKILGTKSCIRIFEELLMRFFTGTKNKI
jgi:hypothetical protein